MRPQLLEPTRTRSTPRWQWLLAGTAATLFLAILQPPPPIAPEGFDPSWCYVLNQQQALGKHLGRDLLHVWGPAGIWLAPWPNPAHVIGSILAGLILHSAIAAATLSIAYHARRPLTAALILLLAAWLLPGLTSEPAVFAAVLLLILADLLQPRWYLALPAALLVGIFAIAKFNLFIGLTALALLHALASWYAQPRSWRAPAMRLGTFALTLTLAALCGFGSAPAFGRWILGGIDLSSGNSEVMSLPSPPASLWYAILSGVLLATMLWPIWQKVGRRIALAWAPLVAVLFYLAFKHGYVRGDGHIVNFHTAMPVLAISGLLLATGWRMVALTLLISATAAAGLSASGADLSPTQFARRLSSSAITTLIQSPASWNTWQRQQHQAIADAADRAAPLRHQLAGHTADIIPCNTTWLEGINCTWSPAPYFQMSLIRSLRSDAANAAHYAGSSAPERILLSLADIDHRNLMHTAPLAMETILANYHVLAADSSTVLLQRGPKWRWTHHSLGQRHVQWGQTIELPPGDQIIAAKIHAWRSTRGKLQKALYRVPPLSIEIQNHALYRFIAPTAPAGIWIRGLPRSTPEVTSLLQTGRPVPDTMATRHFRLLQDPDESCFQPELVVELEEIRPEPVEGATQ